METPRHAAAWLTSRGALAVAVGIAVLAWPKVTLTTLVILLAAHTIVDAGLTLWLWSLRASPDNAVPRIAASRLAIGAVAFFLATYGGLSPTVLLGVCALVSGALELWVWSVVRRTIAMSAIWGAAGSLSLVLGACLLVWPAPPSLGVSLIYGAYVVLFGAVVGAIGLYLRTTAFTQRSAR